MGLMIDMDIINWHTYCSFKTQQYYLSYITKSRFQWQLSTIQSPEEQIQSLISHK